MVMKSAKPILQLTSYYAVVVAVCYAVFSLFPSIMQYSPIGGTAKLSSGISELVSGTATPISIDSLHQMISLGLALFGVLVLMEPVAWVYMGARRRMGRSQSFILTLLLLPVVVAGIVVIVQNSLALAFSLAGIVAAVRFRLTLDDTLDAIFIFVAIGAGLAAGIAALEIALVVTVVFNYAILLFWEIDYGDEVSVNRWFTKVWMQAEKTNDTTSLGPPDA
jgi:hypothetical protein